MYEQGSIKTQVDCNSPTLPPISDRVITRHVSLFSRRNGTNAKPWKFQDDTRFSNQQLIGTLKSELGIQPNPEQMDSVDDLTDPEREIFEAVKGRLFSYTTEKTTAQKNNTPPKSHLLLTNRYIQDRVDQTFADLRRGNNQGIDYMITNRGLRNLRRALKDELTHNKAETDKPGKPVTFTGLEKAVYEETRRRVQGDLKRIEQEGLDLPYPEQLHLARNAVTDALRPKSILTRVGRSQITSNLINMGYTKEMAKDTTIKIAASAMGMLLSYGLNEGITHAAMYLTYRAGLEIGSLSDPHTIALLGISYLAYLKSASKLFQTHTEMINKVGITTHAPAVAANAFTRPLSTRLNSDGEMIVDENRQNQKLQSSYWLPQLANEAYYGVIGLAAPNLFIVANTVGVGYKNLERLALKGFLKKADVILPKIGNIKSLIRSRVNSFFRK